MKNFVREYRTIQFLVIFLLLAIFPAYSQTVIKSTKFSKEKDAYFFINKTFPTIGQSFTATKTGFIASVSVPMDRKASANRATKKIQFWLGSNPDTGDILSGTPYQIIKVPANNEGILNITLKKPFRVEKGKVYRMQFGYAQETGNTTYLFKGATQDSYANGECYFNNGRRRINRDLDFSITIN